MSTIFNKMSEPAYLPSFIIALIILLLMLIKTIRIFMQEGIIQYIKDDWQVRLPHRLRNNRYHGLSRPSYALLCLLYYAIKDLFLLLLGFDVFLIKLIIWDIWKWLFRFENYSWYQKMFPHSYPDTNTQDGPGECGVTHLENEVESQKTITNSSAQSSPNINTLWHHGTEEMWKSALQLYWVKLKESQRPLEEKIAEIHPEDIKNLSAYEFYDFLHEWYYPWKFTQANYLSINRKHLERYLTENRINELEQIKNRLFENCHGDIRECLNIAMGIHGLATAGASGLLSILFPKEFGTVDRFLVYSLLKVDGLKEKTLIEKMNPTSLTANDGTVLIGIMREKAKQLNDEFHTEFWTPRKVDMVLWAISPERKM